MTIGDAHASSTCRVPLAERYLAVYGLSERGHLINTMFPTCRHARVLSKRTSDWRLRSCWYFQDSKAGYNTVPS